MAHSLSFLLSSEAAALRAQRTQTGFVVHAEAGADQFIELDADDAAAAHVIATTWTRNMGVVSAAVRHVRKDGTIGKIDGRIHADSDHYPGRW